MKKQFYSHIITIDSLIIELDSLDLTKKQKQELQTLIETTIHHEILDTILSQLSEEEKRYFLKHLVESSHETVWQYLKEKIANIEDTILHAFEHIKRELQKDIAEVK